jgi:hypothetical protein
MEKQGCKNISADNIDRVDATWSDTKLDNDFSKPSYRNNYGEESINFTRLICEECGSTLFEVLDTGDYETSAQCAKCGTYYIVHSG